jgi:hypothetical protein
MATVPKSLSKGLRLTVDYDRSADVLYIANGKPRPAEGEGFPGGSFVATHSKTTRLAGSLSLAIALTDGPKGLANSPKSSPTISAETWVTSRL